MKNYRKTPCDQKKPPKNSLKKTVELFRIGETFTLMLFGFFVYFGSCAIYRTLAINMPIAMTPAKNRGEI